ncbi:MAG: hypothetical protein LLF80_02640 [Porphyromonadaceae bacterium]|nr:hypothetical protein [Porphyromonadaceae bacterium]
MAPFFQNIRDNTEWLYGVIFEYKLFYYDLWSLVHLWSGAILFALLTAINVKKRWLKLLLILSAFEVVETLFFITVLNLFKPEKSVDVLNDIVIGMLGGYLMYAFFKWSHTGKYYKLLALFISTITIAFLWVGWYGYIYNIPFFNSPYINWWALSCWTLSGVIILLMFINLKDKRNIFFAVTLPWFIYLVVLCGVEYIAYHLLNFREISQPSTPMIFDIVHGSKIMHIYYLTAPVLFIGLFIILNSLLKKNEQT